MAMMEMKMPVVVVIAAVVTVLTDHHGSYQLRQTGGLLGLGQCE
jgi:hypothetical protein